MIKEKYITKYARDKRKKDTHYRNKETLSRALIRSLKQSHGINRIENLCGCKISTLIRHIQKQFKPGMEWSNHGRDGWHIDHIKPCCQFDLTKIEDQKKCFNYKNLRPLWKKDNLSRRKKY